MRVVDMLRALRDGVALPEDGLRQLVGGISSGEIPDYQASAFLMAVYLRGLDDASTATLTLAMRDSGHVIDLSHVPGRKVDKHSTGGVGDKISLPLAPWVAACGVSVPMVSGRGLGHTGGTLDKLGAIPGFRTDLGVEHFRTTVAQLGVAMMGQTAELAPADKKLYALRDVTATVESIPLITSSILAKKLAEGIDALVLDVKVGSGAFMKDLASAEALARSLVRVGRGAGLEVRALLTRMQEPLGRTIGNALEVREALEILRGTGPRDTTELTEILGAHMLVLGHAAPDLDAAQALLRRTLASGAALERFRALIRAHGGDERVVDDPTRLPSAPLRTPILAAQAGFVTHLDAYALGMSAMRLGAGRSRADDTIDPAVGIELVHGRGAQVTAGEPIAWVHHRDGGEVAAELRHIAAAVRLGDVAPPPEPCLLQTISA